MRRGGELFALLAAAGLSSAALFGGYMLLRRRSVPASPSTPPRSSSRSSTPLGGGAGILAEARRALEQGVVESAANTGPVVDTYLRAVGYNPPANWCAAAVTAWMRAAYRKLGGDPPIAGGARAKAFKEQLEQLGRWIPRERLKPSDIRPGMIAVWHRGEPGSWTGHIGVIERVEGTTLHTIEGNSGPRGDRVASMRRELADPRLLGVGSLDPLPIA